MTAFWVAWERSVHYLDTTLEPQLHMQNRLWKTGRVMGVMGDSPDTRRTLAGHSPDTPRR
jgi:hypothetical protein